MRTPAGKSIFFWFIRPGMVSVALLAALLHAFSPPLLIFAGTASAAAPEMPDEPQSLDVGETLNTPPAPTSTGLDEDGYAAGSGRGYTPAQENPLLGKSMIMTPMECAKKYGVAFCACTKLDDGTEACYHQTPSAGYYDLPTCEMIWGSGQCICDEEGACYFPGQEREPKGMSCLDQIFFFPGEKMECRKSGLMTMGNSCCKNKDEATESCGFENLAGELGLDDIALTALSVGNTINNLSGLTGASLSEMAAKAIAESVVETWIKEGTVEGVAASLTKLFGGEFAEAALGGLEELLFEQGAEFVMQELAKEAAVTGGAKVVTTAAISAVASAIASMINIIGIIYAIYQVYNLMSQLAECTPGELMLACRRAKHVCHKVGSRCKIKVFGACLQDMEVYCCFNTQLAKVIHEQGRPQIGMGWGSGKKPLCRGFYADEFVSLDFGRMDFSEYANELTRQMSNNIGPDIEKAMRKAMDNFGLQ